MKKVLRILFAAFGGVLGYGIYLSCKLILAQNSHFGKGYGFTTMDDILIGGVFTLIFIIIFYRMLPFWNRRGKKVASNLEENLKDVSGSELTLGILGLILGMVIASLLAQLCTVIASKYVYFAVSATMYIILGYLGYAVGSRKGSHIVSDLKLFQKAVSLKESFGGERKKKNDVSPKILDTSVIIDGRILEVLNTGFLEGEIIIADFVLAELRHIADSSDTLKRNKGRRGLDILKKIQTTYGVSIYDSNPQDVLSYIPEVDVKLLKLAQIMDGKLVTNDYNLNKVAGVQGISVLNINELTNALKSIALPGESIIVQLVKEGKEKEQAVAYLNDGTMIVVEDGKEMIGQTVMIKVTSVIQTAAGRMIFGRLREKKDV